MTLSCVCEPNGDPDWYWTVGNDYRPMPWFPRRRRCCACQKVLNTGALVVRFARRRAALSDVELAIYGEDGDAVPLAHWWLCEECGDIWWSLYELGYQCVNPDETRQALAEYVGDA